MQIIFQRDYRNVVGSSLPSLKNWVWTQSVIERHLNESNWKRKGTSRPLKLLFYFDKYINRHGRETAILHKGIPCKLVHQFKTVSNHRSMTCEQTQYTHWWQIGENDERKQSTQIFKAGHYDGGWWGQKRIHKMTTLSHSPSLNNDECATWHQPTYRLHLRVVSNSSTPPCPSHQATHSRPRSETAWELVLCDDTSSLWSHSKPHDDDPARRSPECLS